MGLPRRARRDVPGRDLIQDLRLLSPGMKLEREFAITNAVMNMTPEQADRLEEWLRARRLWREQGV